ncbi:MAG: pitrilysin family protein [Candidatus Saccharimonadales bacterium]
MKHNIKEITLKNGAKGLLINVPGASVVRMLVEFRAGFDLGSQDKYELPHVTEHMMFTNKAYPKPRAFSREIEKNGAINNASTSSTSLKYFYECANFEAERIADLLSIQIAQPLFDEKELKTELGNVAEELSSYISNPAYASGYNLRVAAEGEPTLETRIEQLSSVKAEDLYSYYDKTHSADNMRFIIAGDQGLESISNQLAESGLKSGKRLDLPEIPTKHVDKPVVEIRDIPQIYYQLFSAHNKPLSYRQLVAARILSGLLSDGFSSTLLGLAREKGLVYGMYTDIESSNYNSGFMMGGSVSPSNIDEYIDLVVDEISKVLRGEVDADHFESTKKLLLGQRALQYQKLSNLVSYYDSYFTIGYQPFNEFNKLIEEVSLEEAIQEFNKLFAQKTWGVSFLGNIDDKQAAKHYKKLASIWR